MDIKYYGPDTVADQELKRMMRAWAFWMAIESRMDSRALNTPILFLAMKTIWEPLKGDEAVKG